jgi:A/G-specific adenine glycosylase
MERAGLATVCPHDACCGKEIVKVHGGKFPRRPEALRLPESVVTRRQQLPASHSTRPTAVVDGNVERSSNVAGEILPEKVMAIAQELLSPSKPGDFNQAMMELGATVCLPREPLCLACPVRELCVAGGELQQPGKKPRQKREIHFALDCDADRVFLVERPKHASLMPGMWELPEISGTNGTAWLTLRQSITVTIFWFG